VSAPISDVELVAFRHGRLPSERAQEVKQAIAREQEAAARYADIETEIGLLTGALSSAFAPPSRPAIAASIKSAARAADVIAPARTNAAQVATFAASRDWQAQGWQARGWHALAASLILAVGVAGGFGLSELRGGSGGVMTQVETLQTARQESRHAALEFVASGSAELRVADDEQWMVEVTPIRTFRNATGAFCREFIEIWQIEGATSGEVGVACRQQEGGWRSVASYAVD